MENTQSHQGQVQNLSASATANIFANLTGPDRGVLVLGILFLIVFIASLGFLSVSSNVLGSIGACVGLGGLIILLIYWIIISKSYHFDTPLSSLSIAKDTIHIETPVRDPKHLILLMRETIQNRKPLPPPNGKILDGLPSQSDSIEQYSEDEKIKVLQEMKKAHQEQEHDFLQKMKDIENELLDVKLIEDTESMTQGQDDISKNKG